MIQGRLAICEYVCVVDTRVEPGTSHIQNTHPTTKSYNVPDLGELLIAFSQSRVLVVRMESGEAGHLLHRQQTPFMQMDTHTLHVPQFTLLRYRWLAPLPMTCGNPRPAHSAS